MSPSTLSTTSLTLAPGRAPRHGALAALRRRVAAWLVRQLTPGRNNLAVSGALPRAGIQRILVCRPNHRLGNTLLLTPLLSELEAWFPGAEVDVLASGVAARSVCAGYSGVGEVTLIDRRAVRHPLKTVMALQRLRSKRYDLVIDAASSSSSGRLAAGLARARFHLATRNQQPDGMPLHLAARPVAALRWALGLRESERGACPPLDMRLTQPERLAGEAALRRVAFAGEAGDFPSVLVVFPNATGAKRLDGAWWSAFLHALREQCGPTRVVELVAADGASRLAHAYPTYFTSDLRKLAAFIDAAGTYISADCGVMHLAAATSATTIGLFGVTDPARYAPYGRNNVAISCDDGNAVRAAHRVAAHLSAIRHPVQSVT